MSLNQESMDKVGTRYKVSALLTLQYRSPLLLVTGSDDNDREISDIRLQVSDGADSLHSQPSRLHARPSPAFRDYF